MPEVEGAAPPLGFDAELLGFVPVLELGGLAEELALSPAPLASEPVIRT